MAASTFCTFLQNIIIPDGTLQFQYLIDIRSEAWQNLFWEYINEKLFAVYDKAT